MNKLTLLLIGFVTLSINVLAQKQPDKAKDSLLLEQLKMTKYNKDTSADAVVLSDVGNTYILGGFKKYSSRTIKIKILSQAGLSNGQWFIPLYNHNNFGEGITYLAATTYNLEDGRVISTPFDNKELYEEKYLSNERKNSPNIDVERIAMPNVKVGSVIWISYTIKSPYNGYFNWRFQSHIPEVLSEFNLIAPPFVHYMFHTQDIDTSKWVHFARRDNASDGIFTNPGISGTKQYDDIIYTYAYKDVPAFKDETFIACEEDYIMQVGFQLSKIQTTLYSTSGFSNWNSWQLFTDKLLLDLTYFGGYLYSKEGYLNKTAKELKLEGKPEAEKVKTIVNYVKTNYKWNTAYDILSDKKMDDFITEKTGNSAAINLFLTALLKAADIDAKPVMLSTRAHGKIKVNYPFLNFFNDVICYVKTDSLSLLLDGTEPLLPYFALPPPCANGFGYIVQKNDSQWVDLKPQLSAKVMKTMVVQFSPNYDSINSQFTIKASGYSGYQYRKNWNEGYEKFSSMLTEGKGMEVKDSVKVFSMDNPEEPLSILFSASLPLLKTDPARIIFSPFLSETIRDNPLKMSDRQYPVDMDYPHDYKYQSTIVIPAGYKLSEKPEEINYSIANGNATFSYKIKKISDNIIQFTSNMSFNIAVFKPTDYKALKDFYDVAIKKYKELVVLEKI